MAFKATFVAYIDESGDEGWKFEKGSSRWFVLSAVVLRRTTEREVVKIVDAARGEINAGRSSGKQIPGKKPLHFRDLSHRERLILAGYIAGADLRGVSVLMDKTTLSHADFPYAADLYYRAVRLLTERISWYCRAGRTGGETGAVQLVFSHRTATDYKDLQAHLQALVTITNHDYQAAPGIILPDQIETFSAGKRVGLQIADAVATSCLFAVEEKYAGQVHDDYLQQLLPCFYADSHAAGEPPTVHGFGLTVYPDAAEVRRKAGEILWGIP